MLFLVNFELGNIVEILALAATTIGLLVSLYTARKDRKNNTQIQLLEERLKTYNDLCFMSKQLAMPIDIRLYQSKYIEDFNNKTNEIIKDLFLLNNKIRALFDEELYNWSKNLIVNIEKESSVTYMPINGFTTVDIGCERGNYVYNMVNKLPSPFSQQYIQIFNSIWNDKSKLQDVTDIVIENITSVYRENPPEFIYFVTLYNIFREFLDDLSEDVLPNEAVGFKQSLIWNKLYDFQKDAVLAIVNKLEKFNGCILADSVGLGKTFTALAVIKYYENRNKNVLVLCQKKLENNWHTYKDNYKNNPIAGDRLRYDILFHTDLSRSEGKSNGLDLARLNWGAYDLVVIDESHNFRNGGQTYGDDDGERRENRYLQLMNKVIKDGVKTKVLMLSATTVNNRFVDLRNQLALAYEGDDSIINEKLNTKRSIREIFRNAQAAYNSWSKLEPEARTVDNLL